MTRVINIDNKTISLNFIDILPGDSHTWLNSEMSFSFKRKLWRLRSMGLIQIEELPDPVKNESLIIKSEVINTDETNKPEEVIETRPKSKTKKKNTKKKSQSKGE